MFSSGFSDHVEILIYPYGVLTIFREDPLKFKGLESCTDHGSYNNRNWLASQVHLVRVRPTARKHSCNLDAIKDCLSKRKDCR